MTSIDASRLMQMRTAILEQNSALSRAAGLGAPEPRRGRLRRPRSAASARRCARALDQVNESQARASAITESYERGETTDIAAVMLARQQASIGFEATLQVRNRLLSAYRDIMSMPV